MGSRKRARDEMEVEEPPQEPSALQQLRNMWQFANLAQYIFLFGDAVKIDNELDIEELEKECLQPQPSEKLALVGLALLKHVSSHKGLNLEIFDEYTRRQFVAKAPARNPFGTDIIPEKFNDFDIFTKIQVLHQLSVWTLNNPNSIRERMNATDAEQTDWRMEPLGWDSKDRTIFVLDDSRLYRQTDPPPPPPPSKTKSKARPKKSRGTRSNKRRKPSTPEPENADEDDEVTVLPEKDEPEDDGLGGMKWECLCVTMEDYQNYLSGIQRTKDPNEKALYKRIEEEVLPVVAKGVEEQARKEARKLKELQVLQQLATAKRSSRISSRLEKQKEVEEAHEAERRRETELAMAQAESEKQRKMEEARESRMMTREQRTKEREAKRILHEEKLRKLKEDSEKLGSSSNEARLSERHLKAEMKRREEELQKLNEEDEWMFDCDVCHLHGQNLDDGSHSFACERCEVWQHSKCHNITEAQAEQDDFHFICKSCKRKEQEANQTKLPPLKLRLTSDSPSSRNAAQPNGSISGQPNSPAEVVQIPIQRSHVPQSNSQAHPPTLPRTNGSATQPTPHGFPSTLPLMNGPSLSPRGQALGPPGIQRSEAAYGSPSRRNVHSNANVSHPYSTGLNGGTPTNGLPASSPPRYQNPRAPASPLNAYTLPYPQSNGSPFGGPSPFKSSHNQSFGDSFKDGFSRPASSAGPAGYSPVKHSPAPSPRASNGIPSTYNFTNSPHSSFPPSAAQRTSFSPTKHSSPPPLPVAHMSSPAPAPAPLRFAPSPTQMPAQMLPNPLPAPEKHDGARPISSHDMSETPILPPIKSLSPTANPQILSPPTKKQSPTPDRSRLISENGYSGPP